jgi:hypothetical protein
LGLGTQVLFPFSDPKTRPITMRFMPSLARSWGELEAAANETGQLRA